MRRQESYCIPRRSLMASTRMCWRYFMEWREMLAGGPSIGHGA